MIEIMPVNVRTANGEVARLANDHLNRMQREWLPDDPPKPLEENLQSWHNLPEFIQEQTWIAWNESGERVIAHGWMETWLVEDNPHLGFFDIGVAPDYRRQGIARRLLRLVTEEFVRRGKTLILANTNERVPAGEKFMQRIGAEIGQVRRTSQLLLKELDHSLIQRWLDQGRQMEDRFALGFWEGVYPEEYMPAIVALYQLVNDVPRDNLEIEDEVITAEELRQFEQQGIASGYQRWTCHVTEKETGRFAGFTEVHWHPNRPELLQQRFTAVYPEFRGSGIGRWLKAAMIDRVLRERPQVAYVRTGNAESNAPMLKINIEMGFKPYMTETAWQVKVDSLLSYLRFEY